MKRFILLCSILLMAAGCTDKKEFQAFEPFIPPHLLAHKSDSLKKILKNDPKNQDALTEYGIVLSDQLAQNYSLLNNNYYWRFNEKEKNTILDTLESIVSQIHIHTPRKTLLLEKQIVNYLLCYNFLQFWAFEQGWIIDKVKQHCDEVIKQNPNSDIARIAIWYSYRSIKYAEKRDSLRQIILSQNIIHYLFWLHGMDVQWDLNKEYGWRYVESENKSRASIMVTSHDNFIVPMKYERKPYYAFLETFSEKIPSYKIFHIPFYFSITPFIRTGLQEDEIKKYVIEPLRQLRNELPEYDGKIQHALISYYLQIHDTLSTQKELVEYYSRKNIMLDELIWEDDGISEYLDTKKTVLPILNLYLLSKWSILHTIIAEHKKEQWLQTIDSLKILCHCEKQIILPYEIIFLADLVDENNYRDSSLIHRLEVKNEQAADLGANYSGRYIYGLITHGNERYARYYADKMFAILPDKKDDLLFDLIDYADTSHAMMIIQFIKKYYSKNPESIKKAEIYYARQTMWWYLWSGTKEGLKKYEALQKIVPQFDRYYQQQYYINLKELYDSLQLYEKALVISDTLKKYESIMTPFSEVNRAYYYYKMGKKEETEKIFLWMEKTHPNFTYQYEIHMRVLLQQNKMDEARKLFFENRKRWSPFHYYRDDLRDHFYQWSRESS